VTPSVLRFSQCAAVQLGFKPLISVENRLKIVEFNGMQLACLRHAMVCRQVKSDIQIWIPTPIWS